MTLADSITNFLCETGNPFPFHKELHSKFWTNYTMNTRVKNHLLAIVKDELKDGVDLPVTDVIFTGSMADYNYNRYSDLDVHIIIDADAMELNEITEDYLDLRGKAWGLKHNIKIFGHEVELYFQSNDSILHARGIYSILKDKWLKIPDNNAPDINLALVNFKFSKLSTMIHHLDIISDEGLEDPKTIYKKAKSILEKIKDYRKDGLDSDKNIFSVGNLIFKRLRQENDIAKLIAVIEDNYDKYYSITNKDIPTVNEGIYVPNTYADTQKVDPRTGKKGYQTYASNISRRRTGKNNNKHKNIIPKAVTKNNQERMESPEIFQLKQMGGGTVFIGADKAYAIALRYGINIPRQTGEYKSLSNSGIQLGLADDGRYFLFK